MTSFADELFIGQHWRHKINGEMARIAQIHRKDRQAKLYYVNSEDEGSVEYKNFDLLKKYWEPMEILLHER